jgi:hypothetical protein
MDIKKLVLREHNDNGMNDFRVEGVEVKYMYAVIFIDGVFVKSYYADKKQIKRIASTFLRKQIRNKDVFSTCIYYRNYFTSEDLFEWERDVHSTHIYYRNYFKSGNVGG